MAPICDFCCQAPPTWTFPCHDFTSHEIGMTFKSTGGWGACNACYALVEAGDRSGLVARSLGGHPERFIDPLGVKRQIGGRIDLFFVNREGEAVPTNPDDWSDPTR